MPDTADLALEKRRSIACRIADLFGSHPEVSVILVFGSVATGYVDERSDIDILLICHPGILPVTARRYLLSSIGSGWHFHDQSNDNALFADCDVDGSVEGVFVTMHYQTVSWISEVLSEVLDKGAISTEKMPFRPYTLPALLQRAWLLNDRDKFVERWREQAQRFPQQLQLNLLRHFVPMLRENLEDLVANAERRLGPRAFIFRINWAVDALTGILFALNEVYDPADRRTERIILPTLVHVPKSFTSRLTEVLEGPFDDMGALYRAWLFKQLANEVLQLAESQIEI